MGDLGDNGTDQASIVSGVGIYEEEWMLIHTRIETRVFVKIYF
jgi:hypothetical protein